MGKGENSGYQHFLLFPQCFEKASFSGSLKVRIAGTELNQDYDDISIDPLGPLNAHLFR